MKYLKNIVFHPENKKTAQKSDFFRKKELTGGGDGAIFSLDFNEPQRRTPLMLNRIAAYFYSYFYFFGFSDNKVKVLFAANNG